MKKLLTISLYVASICVLLLELMALESMVDIILTESVAVFTKYLVGYALIGLIAILTLNKTSKQLNIK